MKRCYTKERTDRSRNNLRRRMRILSKKRGRKLRAYVCYRDTCGYMKWPEYMCTREEARDCKNRTTRLSDRKYKP